MTEKAYLPIGSLVIPKGMIRKFMIINRANIVENEYFDYGAVLYPEGMVEGNMVYFNKEDILKVVSVAFTDDDDTLLIEQLLEAKKEFLERASQASVKPVVESESVTVETVTTEEDDPFAVFTEEEDDE